MVDELYISKNRKYKNNCSSFEFVWALFFRHILKCVIILDISKYLFSCLLQKLYFQRFR